MVTPVLVTWRRREGVVVPMPRLVPSNVSAVPEVMEVPLKKLTPFVVWEVALVPPLATAKVPVVSERAMPKEDVAVSEYPPVAVPTRRLP